MSYERERVSAGQRQSTSTHMTDCGPPHVPDYFDTSFIIPEAGGDNVRKINLINSASSEEELSSSDPGPGLRMSDQALSPASSIKEDDDIFKIIMK